MLWGNKEAIERLRDEVADLKRRISALQLEWDDVLDRLRRRAANAARAAQRLEEIESHEGASPEDGQGAEETITAGLSPRARSIQARVLAARSRIRVPQPPTKEQ